MKHTKKKLCTPASAPPSVHAVIARPQQRAQISKSQLISVLASEHPPILRCSRRLTELKERLAFYRLLGDDVIKCFLAADVSYKVSDKYLLSMVLIYFRRIGLRPEEYNRTDFFMGLFVANSMEEDQLQCKYWIIPWILGKGWQTQHSSFIRQRDDFWRRLDHRAWVRSEVCEELMAFEPTLWAWKRERVPPISKDTIARVKLVVDPSVAGPSSAAPVAVKSASS